MKNKYQKIYVITCIILFLFLLSCTPQSQQIANNTISAMNQVRSYTLNTSLTETDIIIEKNASQITPEHTLWTSQRVIEISKHSMYMSMDSHDIDNSLVTPTIFERYFDSKWMYTKNSEPFVYPQNIWIKFKAGNKWWSNESQLEPQIELIKSAVAVTNIGIQNEKGNESHVIELVPSAEAAADWVLSQDQDNGPSMWWGHTGPERSKQIYIKAFHSGSVTLWIDKKTNLILRADINLNFDGAPGDITPEDTGVPQPSINISEHVIRDFNGEWDFSNYNKTVDIQIPQEALEATEVH